MIPFQLHPSNDERVVDLIRPLEAGRLHDELRVFHVTSPETGEAFTVVEIDRALQLAVETVNGREGTRIVDIFDPTWRMIRDDFAAALGLERGVLSGVTL